MGPLPFDLSKSNFVSTCQRYVFSLIVKAVFYEKIIYKHENKCQKREALNFKCDINYVVEEMVFGIPESYGKVK